MNHKRIFNSSTQNVNDSCCTIRYGFYRLQKFPYMKYMFILLDGETRMGFRRKSNRTLHNAQVRSNLIFFIAVASLWSCGNVFSVIYVSIEK